MNHFVVTFTATVDGSHTETRKVGSVSPSMDYKPNAVKEAITIYYKKKYPEAKSVAIVIVSAPKVTLEQYETESKYFIEIG